MNNRSVTESSVQTKNRIKVLYTIPNFDTAGSGKVVYDLVKHLDKTKFEPHIACTHNRGDFFKTVQALEVPIHIRPITTPYRPYWSFPYRVWKLSRFLKKYQFDLIHSWHWSSDVSEPLAARMAGIPFVYTKKAMGWGNKAWRWRSQLSTHIITINDDMLKFFKGMEYKVLQIPIGVDIEKYKPIIKSYVTPNGENYKQSDFIIVSVANLVPVKGIELLLEAVKIINNPNIKVLIIGDDSSDYAQQLKLKYKNDNIRFTGKIQDVIPYLELSDLFVIPTKNEGRKEGQPIAPVEAMLCNRMVIGADIAGIKDVLDEFKEQLFKPNDSIDLSNTIKKVLQMPLSQRQSISDKMTEYAQKKYNIKASIKAHEKLYINLKKRIII
ncbi:glycosyltransferase [Winogradskyella sp. A3E31]|uniref:glycosyltransferase n=1 Tax=Winogradskyella sp. A3E31 TaxID=3349637 RepID=UPI00398B9316